MFVLIGFAAIAVTIAVTVGATLVLWAVLGSNQRPWD
jgi:hypothetical protein